MQTHIQVHDETIEKLLRHFKTRGGVLNYFVFRCNTEWNEIDHHRAVAREALRLLVKQRNQRFLDEAETHYANVAKELEKKIERQRNKRDLSEIDYRRLAEKQYPIGIVEESIDESVFNQDVPQRIPLEDFIGSGTGADGYHRAFFSTPDPSLHDLPSGETRILPEELEAMKERKENSEFYFSRALPRDKIIFAALNDRLFGDAEHLIIYRWGTKCSNFFQDEDEYLWGNYFWTIYSPTYNWYVVILAAATID